MRSFRAASLTILAACLLTPLALLPAGAAAHARSTPGRRASGFCANTSLRPSPSNIQLIREATFCLVNREREHYGLRPLQPNLALRSAAQGHSRSMAFGGYFAHVGPHGYGPLARIRAAGYIPRWGSFAVTVGENIAWGSLWLASPGAIVRAWMNSPEHRANILDPAYRDTAIGVSPHVPGDLAGGQAGAVYTEDFAALYRR